MAARALSPSSSFKSTSGQTRESAIQEVYASLAVPGPGVRLLALDDGGIRGLSMLLLVRDIFHHIQRASGLPSLPLPCEYFDIIAGSGTGGLIALMLGRLRLSIEDAIECYTRIVGQVFSQIKADGSFKATSFEKLSRRSVVGLARGRIHPFRKFHQFNAKHSYAHGKTEELEISSSASSGPTPTLRNAVCDVRS
ncbi:hypothetical protein BD626DRAFT_608564 [Schizophyllum amplum]|uniref:PNPLA domain-containing protein n=1 Tax=Schizophyllum amplum TaxID=97359 RepID=A0A550C323_9AGAR|nr:hypothetical protein BD626DRAFT_608564 [Auriculariopsis ampla]